MAILAASVACYLDFCLRLRLRVKRGRLETQQRPEKNGNMKQKVLAIVPAYNEEESIVATVEDLLRNAPGIDYVVVNDGSQDNTAKYCRERGYNLISLPVNLGLAGAFQVGMKYALQNSYDYAVQFDADGQHPAAYILPMVEKAKATRSDIVIGSRFCDEKKPFSPRMIGSTFITWLIRLTTGKTVVDSTSGMRLFDRKMIAAFATEIDLGPEPDSLVLLMRSGAKVVETQVKMRDRMAGESYLTVSKSIQYMLRVCVSILFVQWFRKKVCES